MRSFLALIKLSLIQMLTSVMQLGSKKKTAGPVAVLILLGAIFLFISGAYSFGIASALAQYGALDIMLMNIAVLGVIIALVFSVLSAQSTVFATKDLDFILSIPVSTFKVMLARLLSLYLEVLITIELFLLPAGAAWLYYGGGGGVLFMLHLIFSGVLLAFIPTLIALVFGGLISLLVAKLPYKNLFISLFSVLVTIAVLIFSFSISSATDAMPESPDAMRALFVNAIPPAGWFVSFVEDGQLTAAAGLIAIGLLPFLLLCRLFSMFYKRLLTLLSSHRLKSDYKLRSLSSSGSFSALLRKELSKFLSTPIYLLNCGIGIILLFLASFAALLFKSNIDYYLRMIFELAPEVNIAELFPGIILLVVCFCLGTCSTSSVSISLEGKTLWILKEAPISDVKIFAAKIGLNFLLSAGSVIVCVPVLGYSLSLPVLEIAALTLVALLAALLLSMQGLLINLLFPRLDAENDTRVVKQSASVIIQMLTAFIEIFLFGVLYYSLFSAGLGFYTIALITGTALLLLNLIILMLLNTKGRRRFAAL